MHDKKKKTISFFIFFFAIFLFLFFVLTNDFASAKLEAPYPQIAGKTVTSASSLPDFAIYLFSAGMAIGFSAVFISLIWAGVLYFLSPISAQIKSDAKDRIGGAISGLLILLLTYLIVTTINPDLKTFRLSLLPPLTALPSPKIEISGVLFYNSDGCTENTNPANTDETTPINTYSISDLGDLKNRVRSVKIIQDSDESYISILYENVDFWGKCLYLDPNTPCQSALDPDFRDVFADSASIYRYDFNPTGNGVSFYRNPYFDKSGGVLEITNNQIKSGDGGDGLYTKRLDELYFINDKQKCTVPEEEQDCIKYDEKGKCSKRRCPSLAGENISSVEIKDDYLVLFTYAGPGLECADVMADLCQEFPTPDDENKDGPQQIKWEHIRNDGEGIPNCVIIVPIKY